MAPAGRATLDGMPMEIQLEIMRRFLKYPFDIKLFPVYTYTNHSWHFGSLGILRVSKHFSTLGLSVLYGENKFIITRNTYALEELDESEENEYDGWPRTLEHLKFVRWTNLRNLPKNQLTTISSVDCLDLISQTQPGQEQFQRVYIRLTEHGKMLFLGGSLLRILRRLRGLKSLELELAEGWDEFIPTKCLLNSSPIKPERYVRDFRILIKNELGHIKVIKSSCLNSWTSGKRYISDWISHELEKRNKAWAPPPPAYMNFHRTSSSMSVLHPQVIKLVTQAEDNYKPRRDKKSVLYLEDVYGVFP